MVYHTTWMTSIEERPTAQEPAVSTGISGMYIMYIIVGIIGFLDNLLVVVVIATSRSMRKRRTNWLLINQSVIDMLTGGILAGQAYTPTIRISGMAAILYCKLWDSAHFLWVFAITSTYNLIIITLERYLAIVRPVWHKIHVTGKVTAVAMATPWLIGNIYGLYIAITSIVVDEKCLNLQFKSVEEGRIVGIITFVVQFTIPLLIMIFCYIRIFLVFTGCHQEAGSDAIASNADQFRSKARENILKTLVAVCVAFFLCWVWNQVFFLLLNLGLNVSMSSPFYPFSVAAGHANCAINPLIYAARYTEFRRAFVRLVRRGKVGTEGDSSALGDTSTNTAA